MGPPRSSPAAPEAPRGGGLWPRSSLVSPPSPCRPSRYPIEPGSVGGPWQNFCMISDDLADLDAAAVLAAAEDLTLEQRARDVDLLLLVLHWADMHGDDPGEGRALGSD